jgi:MoaA/NifB/PqqE/SkfB family radical SAM enzyme
MDLTVITTYRCDSKCQMCYIWQNPSVPKEEISLETLRKLPSNFDNINISGGEPTNRKDLSEIVDILVTKGKVVGISSNGLHYEKILPIIKKYPNVKVRFSLEGSEITNNSIRGEKDGFNKKVNGMKKLIEAGGKDLGFAFVIQDENVKELMYVYEITEKLGIELSTSTLHNAWQFHKNDNYFYEKIKVAKKVEPLITALLRSNSVKNWFRAYLNLGLINKILGKYRLMKCTAGTDFIFIDPWSDVYACNVRSDLYIGNLVQNDWKTVLESPKANEIRRKVDQCKQNCWMITTATTSIRNHYVPAIPRISPLMWVVINKVRLRIGMNINFSKYVDYGNVKADPIIKRQSYLNIPFKKKIETREEKLYKDQTYVNG